ncbi:hypothetical protein I4000191A8_22870 [Clostridia bacterium i40-0019-1A8]
MAEASDTWGIFYQNLIDAGCDQEMVRQCVILAKAAEKADLLQLLSKHRSILLRAVHENQKRIDHLDFLIYQMSKR